ncbi:MAG: PadR family transcriptional regulator [Dehalococcoidia bacterium]
MVPTRTDTRRSQLLRGALDLCLLATISRGPTYGYEMTRRLADLGLTAVAEGSIYPVLGRLEHQGLVDTSRQESNGGPPRKYYRLSAAGRSALAEWREEWTSTRSAIDAVLAAPLELTAGQDVSEEDA